MKRSFFSILFVFLLLGFQNCKNSNKDQTLITDTNGFFQMLYSEEVRKFIIFDNKNEVEIYIKKNSLAKYQEQVRNSNVKFREDGPHFSMKIAGWDVFSRQVTDFYKLNPRVREVEMMVAEKK